ncbi:MAG: DinB family protein [Chloroflexia bacterium]|nr:DinB family protein [Chloroflexia bacterium]
MRDVTPVLAGHMTIEDYAEGITTGDLPAISGEVYDFLTEIAGRAGAAEIAFLPADEAASDGSETGWRLAHVICHVTAGLEEGAALASTLARGAEVTGRSRFETPWASVRTPDQLRQRVAESRRMSDAFLQTWPDQPDLETTDTPVPRFGPLNAIHRHLLGIIHAESHRAQLAGILDQAAAASVSGARARS